MNRSLCILLAFCFLSCGGNSTGPEPEPEPITEPQPEPIPKPRTSDLIIDLPGGVRMAFIWVEPDTLTVEGLGLYTIEIPKGYYLGKYELTQQQWEQVMHTSHWPQRAETGFTEPVYPAYDISYVDAQDFAKKLTALQNDGIYRLPTSIEWEYASRAGVATSFWFFGSSPDSLSDYAWWGKNVDSAQIVGTKLPNPWGFYDIYGNVWEWTQSGRSSYLLGNQYYLKGGSYDTTPAYKASSIWFILVPATTRDPQLGVRILREGPKVSQP